MAPLRSVDLARVTLLAALLAAGTGTRALESMDDSTLSGIAGRDGIEIDTTSSSGLSLQQFRWITDSGAVLPSAANPCTGGVADRHACTIIGNTTLAGVGGPLAMQLRLDAGAASTAGDPYVGAVLDWNPMALTLGSLTYNTPTVNYSANSIGSISFQSDGLFQLVNRGGLFNSSGNHAFLNFTATGDIIYRQGGAGSAELSFGNFQFTNRFSNGAAGGQLDGPGRIGFDNQGLIVSAPFADTDLLFDLAFKAAPINFDTSGRNSIILFGWTGGLANPQLRLSPGGTAYGTYSTTANNLSGASYSYFDHNGTQGGGARSEGININASWDFDSDFSWVIGQAGGNRTQVRFSNWRRMGSPASPPPMLAMPVTFDVMQGASGQDGLCFGGGFTAGVPTQFGCSLTAGEWISAGVPTGNAALAVQIRDGHLHAYNQTVEVFDPTSAAPYSAYRWSLLYTFGKLDANIFLYPQGRAAGVPLATTSTGLRADITLAAQSPGFWDRATSSVAATRATAGAGWATNTHFMLADTAVGGNNAVQYGVGLVNADLLWRVRDMYFRVTAGDAGYPLLPGGLWLQTDTLAQYRFRGLFGGGDLTNLVAPTAVGLIDLNLQANRFIFVLSPQAPVAGDAPIGFDGLLDLDGTSYLSVAEVSSPSSSWRLHSVGGRVGWKDGTVNLVSSQNAADSKPRLAIDNDLLFGTSATFGDGPGAPLVGTVGFGTETFGRMALPAGTWHSNVTIKIPNL
ncbi:MAG: DUF6160 family protein [Gammaproteobacteria bacterium]